VVHCDEHRDHAVEIIEQLRQQDQCPLEITTGRIPLTLREQQAGKIVAGFRVIRLEHKDLLVKLGRLVRLSVMLVPNCLTEQLAERRHRRRVGLGAVNPDGSALHAHGAAFFSIHPNRLLRQTGMS